MRHFHISYSARTDKPAERVSVEQLNEDSRREWWHDERDAENVARYEGRYHQTKVVHCDDNCDKAR